MNTDALKRIFFPHAYIRDVEKRAAYLKELAYRDELTDIYNRRAFFALVPPKLKEREAYARTQKGKRKYTPAPLVIAAIDLDRFKEINDTYGHGVGDIYLREFAKTLGSALRGTDIVARLGGDEFAVAAETAGSNQDAILGSLKDALTQAGGIMHKKKADTVSSQLWSGFHGDARA